jgi:hypothetical protein
MAAKNFGRVNVSITASTGGLTAGLSRAGKQLTGFSSSVGGMNGSLAALSAQVADGSVLFSDVGGLLGTVALSFKNGALATHLFRGSIQLLIVTIKALLIPLAIVTSITAFFTALGSAARDLDEASKSAHRLGMSMTTFQNLSQVADEAGVSIGQMSGLLTVMTRNLGNLTNGSKSAQKAFAGIGLTLADLQGLSPDRQFELIAQRIMALPTAAERTAAAMSIFGRQGAAAMGLISDVASGAYSDIAKLREQLGLNLTDSQVKGIEMMNDSIGRTSMVFQGFINQFLAGLAPAIATVANLFVKFFAENKSGFSIAQTMADGLTHYIRLLAGHVVRLTGAFQILSSFVGVFVAGALKAFEGVTWALQNMLSAMADAAEALPGIDVGLSSSLRSAADSVSGLSTAAGDEAALWGQAAADNFGAGIQNITDPFAAFDAEFASVTSQMQQAGAAAGTSAGQSISTQLAASTKALKAIVVGTSDGEAFRNSIMRGADPRLEGDAQKETAENTGEMVDQLDELNGNLAGSGGFGLAAITV